MYFSKGNMDEDNPYSQTFCVYPWMEMIIGPVSTTRICCIASDDLYSSKGEPYDMGKISLENIWNGEGMREIRKKMIEGKKVKACSHCYYQESIGEFSYRKDFNKQWLNHPAYGKQIKQRIEESLKSSFQVTDPPLYLDIRPGNTCNLKCRMCNPGNSSKIFTEQKVLIKKNKLLANLVNTNVLLQTEEDLGRWHTNPDIWKKIDEWLPKIKRLYFTGGEPTLIKRNWLIINKAIEKGYSHDMTLHFNLNCTYIPDKLLKTFNKFSYIFLSLSIDGLKDVQEYIRYPSQWKSIEKNIEKLLKNKTDNVQILFSPVVQVYNILSLTDLLRWIDDLSLRFETKIITSLIICTGPEYYNISSLSYGIIRKEALKEIKEYRSTYQGEDKLLVESLSSIEYALEKKQIGNTEHNRKRFFQYTKMLDKHRGNSFLRSLPRLGKLLQEEYDQTL